MINNIKLFFIAFILIATIILTYIGLTMDVPNQKILYQTIRNVFLHVPMWFVMTSMFIMSFIHSIRYIRNRKLIDDAYNESYITIGLLFSFMGIVTGAIWASGTWGEAWSNDPKQNSTAIATIIYIGNLLLRNAYGNNENAKFFSALYSIFSFPLLILLIYVLPKFTDSLHPGDGGNTAFISYDLDFDLRVIFYPLSLSWIMVGFVLSSIYKHILIMKTLKT